MTKTTTTTIRMYYYMLSQFNLDNGSFIGNPLKGLDFVVPEERAGSFCTWKEMRTAVEQLGKKRTSRQNIAAAGTAANEATADDKIQNTNNSDEGQRFESDGCLAYRLSDALTMLTAGTARQRRSNHEWMNHLRVLVETYRPHTLLPDDLLFARGTVVIQHVPSAVERAVLQNKEYRAQSITMPDDLPENVRMQIVLKQTDTQSVRIPRDQHLCSYCYPSAVVGPPKLVPALEVKVRTPESTEDEIAAAAAADADQDYDSWQPKTTAKELFKDVERAARKRRRVHANDSHSIDQGPHTQDTCLQTLLRYDPSRVRSENVPGLRRVKYQTAFGIPRSQLRVATEEEIAEGFAMMSPGQSRYVVRKNFVIPK